MVKPPDAEPVSAASVHQFPPFREIRGRLRYKWQAASAETPPSTMLLKKAPLWKINLLKKDRHTRRIQPQAPRDLRASKMSRVLPQCFPKNATSRAKKLRRNFESISMG